MLGEFVSGVCVNGVCMVDVGLNGFVIGEDVNVLRLLGLWCFVGVLNCWWVVRVWLVNGFLFMVGGVVEVGIGVVMGCGIIEFGVVGW